LNWKERRRTTAQQHGKCSGRLRVHFGALWMMQLAMVPATKWPSVFSVPTTEMWYYGKHCIKTQYLCF